MDAPASIDQIKRQAEHAADGNSGPQVNHYLEGSEARRLWNEFYYAKVQQLAMECV